MLRIDIVCLDYDGNFTDAAILATLCALAGLKIPSIEIVQDTHEVVITDGTILLLENTEHLFILNYLCLLF